MAKKRNVKMNKLPSTVYKLGIVKPKTHNQEKVFQSFPDYNLVLEGCAGTGKTYVALYLALESILEHNEFDKVVIIRSSVATRNLGFMPGSAREKMAEFEAPYIQLCDELFGRSDAFDSLKARNILEFESTSYLRGTTFRDTIVIIDECSNLTFHELDTVMTRIGENCRIIMCGDYFQSDLRSVKERKGFLVFLKILKAMPSFRIMEFTEEDILRSDLVREYIINKRQVLNTSQTKAFL